MKHLIEDQGLQKLEEQFLAAAKYLEKQLLEERPILMRYHDDGDGVYGALIMKRALEQKAADLGVTLVFASSQSGSAIYSPTEARKDAADYYEANPLLLLVDFGLNEDSAEAVALVRKQGFSVLAIDHHPYPKGIEKKYDQVVSPTLIGLGGEYCAGLLCYEVASAMDCNPSEYWARAAMKSDNSTFKREEDDLPARAIDYLLITSSVKRPLSYYEKIAEDRELLASHYAEAMAKLDEMLRAADAHVKIRELPKGAHAILINLDKICTEKNTYPSKGKAVNEIQFKYAKQLGGAIVSLGYTSDRISFRANAEAASLGIAANPVIARLKNEMSNDVESGGGHEVAAALKVRKGTSKFVVDRFVELVSEQISSSS